MWICSLGTQCGGGGGGGAGVGVAMLLKEWWGCGDVVEGMWWW